MANIKSDFEKAKKAISEANALLNTEKLITHELNFQKSIRGDLLSLMKSGGTAIGVKILPGMKSMKQMVEREAYHKLKIKETEAKIQAYQAKTIGTGVRAAAQHKSHLLHLKRSIAGHQGNLSKVVAQQQAYTKLMGLIKGAGSTLASALVYALGVFKQFDDEASRLRMRMGFLRKDVEGMEKGMYRSWIALTGVGVTMKELTGAVESVAESFGSVYTTSGEVRDNIALWQAQLGVASKNGTEVLRVFGQLGRSSADAQISMGNFLTRMTAAAGVPLNETMGDIAAASKTSYSMLARSPLAIAKAAVEARRLGTTLDAIAKSGKSLLNFTDSINAEMNASVLIGKSINLQRARELAYRRDMRGLNEEIVRLARDEVDFNTLDTFQQEAFAAALGKSVDEVAKMLQAETQMNWVRSSGTDEMKQQLAQLEAMKKVNENMANDIGKQAEQSLRTQANQSKLNELSNTWSQLMMEVVDIFVPIVRGVISIATWLLKVLKPLIKMAAYAYLIYYAFVLVKAVLLAIGAALSWPVVAILAAVAAVTLLVYHWKTVWKYVKMVGSAIWEGIVSVGGAIFNAIIWPFKKAYEWLSGVFLGRSPSQIGLMIAEGIKAVGKMIFNNLLWPFKLARWAIRKLFGGKDILGEVGAPAIAEAGDDAAGVVRNAGAQTTAVNTEKRSMYDMSKGFNGIMEAINGLRADLLDGKIAVYMDSQLVSLHSHRNTLHRKGYGTNNAVAM